MNIDSLLAEEQKLSGVHIWKEDTKHPRKSSLDDYIWTWRKGLECFEVDLLVPFPSGEHADMKKTLYL